MSTTQEVSEEHSLLSPEVSEFITNSSTDEDAIDSSPSVDNVMLPASGKPNNLEEEITQACNSIVGVAWEEVNYYPFCTLIKGESCKYFL